ncbi:MAG: hypothetical protein NWQ55_03880 [Salibacteraceae bacterium]|nr:hypothetical protein [Salibacteraceae bacterium]MDP4763629.1 hypothetical protein [Salibacteraceae bacterium]MDP4964189.1 hypothetical protein [Salibacteraceae bacterium]
MKKIALGILIGFTLTAIYFAVDSIVNSKEIISKETAFITLKNESDFKIVKATLDHGYGEITITNIGKDETAYLGFRNGSENSYILTIQFENDSLLRTKGNYFEYGFRGIETVKNDTIISEDNW